MMLCSDCEKEQKKVDDIKYAVMFVLVFALSIVLKNIPFLLLSSFACLIGLSKYDRRMTL